LKQVENFDEWLSSGSNKSCKTRENTAVARPVLGPVLQEDFAAWLELSESPPQEDQEETIRLVEKLLDACHEGGRIMKPYGLKTKKDVRCKRDTIIHDKMVLFGIKLLYPFLPDR